MSKHELSVVKVRLIKESPMYSDKPLTNPTAIADFMAEEMADYDREVLCVLNMTSKCQAINMNIVSMGSINAAIVEMRELYKTAILSNAASIIVLHNHRRKGMLTY